MCNHVHFDPSVKTEHMERSGGCRTQQEGRVVAFPLLPFPSLPSSAIPFQ